MRMAGDAGWMPVRRHSMPRPRRHRPSSERHPSPWTHAQGEPWSRKMSTFDLGRELAAGGGGGDRLLPADVIPSGSHLATSSALPALRRARNSCLYLVYVPRVASRHTDGACHRGSTARCQTRTRSSTANQRVTEAGRSRHGSSSPRRSGFRVDGFYGSRMIGRAAPAAARPQRGVTREQDVLRGAEAAPMRRKYSVVRRSRLH